MIQKYLLILIVLFGFTLRFYGLDWDQGQHLHPDERFMTIVSSTISLPSTIFQYFDSMHSPLNPYNHDITFYVYGTVPLLLTRIVAEFFKMTSYDSIYLIGRALSIFLDTATILLIYKSAQKMFKKENTALLAAFFYAIAVFPIQQAHFFTSDSFMLFFSTATFLSFISFFQKKKLVYIVLTGFFLGLTLASKISISITVPFLFFCLCFVYFKKRSDLFTRLYVTRTFCAILTLLIVTSLTFRIFQPYAFDSWIHVSSHFVENISEAHKMITGEIDYPPNIQWAYSKPILEPLVMMFVYGFGPALSLLIIFGLFLILSIHKNRPYLFYILLGYAGIIFFYQGIQLAKYMRYFYPMYPVLVIAAGVSAEWWIEHMKGMQKKIGLSVGFLLLLVWPMSFITLYSRNHSRVQASYWMYSHISPDSYVTSEEWDDSLPLPLNPQFTSYHTISMGLYTEETYQKWVTIEKELNRVDYIILSSNRLYGSIPKLPQRYPVARLYYRLLFEGKLGFKKVAEITSFPTIPFTNIQFDDSLAEESFTVYDHPKIIIFKKDQYSPKLLEPLLNAAQRITPQPINPMTTNKLF